MTDFGAEAASDGFVRWSGRLLDPFGRNVNQPEFPCLKLPEGIPSRSNTMCRSIQAVTARILHACCMPEYCFLKMSLGCTVCLCTICFRHDEVFTFSRTNIYMYIVIYIYTLYQFSFFQDSSPYVLLPPSHPDRLKPWHGGQRCLLARRLLLHDLLRCRWGGCCEIVKGDMKGAVRIC